MQILTKLREERWLDVSSSRLDVRGTPATVGVAIDVTDRKRQEEQLKRLVGQLHVLTSKLQSAREEEKTSLAREIHDQLGQTLTTIKIELTRVLQAFENTGEPPQSAVHSILEFIDQAILEVRHIATNLRPGALDVAGLAAAIE